MKCSCDTNMQLPLGNVMSKTKIFVCAPCYNTVAAVAQDSYLSETSKVRVHTIKTLPMIQHKFVMKCENDL